MLASLSSVIFAGNGKEYSMEILLWAIATGLAGLVIGYWLARRSYEDNQLQAAVTAASSAAIAALPEATVAPTAAAKAVDPDDLSKIEGVGPKIAELINGGGIMTFAQLAAAPVERLQELLDGAGERYRVHNPATWPMQAGLATDGKWDELEELQDRLDGGKLT